MKVIHKLNVFVKQVLKLTQQFSKQVLDELEFLFKLKERINVPYVAGLKARIPHKKWKKFQDSKNHFFHQEIFKKIKFFASKISESALDDCSIFVKKWIRLKIILGRILSLLP